MNFRSPVKISFSTQIIQLASRIEEYAHSATVIFTSEGNHSNSEKYPTSIETVVYQNLYGKKRIFHISNCCYIHLDLDCKYSWKGNLHKHLHPSSSSFSPICTLGFKHSEKISLSRPNSSRTRYICKC